MINRNHLAAFRTVVEAGGFTRAAEILLVSQSAVSQQIAELEKTTGKPLLERLGRGVRPTEAGETLLSYARRIAALEIEADRAMRTPAGTKPEKLSVGGSLRTGTYLLPSLLGTLRSSYPSVEMELVIASDDKLQKLLVHRKLDMVLTEETTTESNALQMREVGEETFIAMASPDHALGTRSAGKKRPRLITADQFCSQPMVVLQSDCPESVLIQRALGRCGGVLGPPVLSLSSFEAIKRAVISGLGVAIISEMCAETELCAGLLVEIPIRGFELRRPLVEVSLKGHTPSPVCSAFTSILEDHLGR